MLLGLLFGLLVVIDRLAPVDLTTRPGSQVVTTADDQLLRAFADAQGVWRYPITLAEVSPYYLEALMGYEDRFFYRHPGVNPFALIRAAGQAVWYGEVVSGGSTLTMQVARLRYAEPRTLTGKLKEMIRALQLDWHYSKAEILTYYLNHAPFGGTLEGVQAASLSYLGYPARDLTRAQAALLAVLPQAPSRYRPDRHPERAEAARNKLMQRLADQGVWSAEMVADAREERVIAVPIQRYQTAPLLARRLVDAAAADATPERTHRTALNLDWQRQVEALVPAYVQAIDRQVSAAVMIMDNRTGLVRTYVGSADFNDPERAAHVDMITAIRSPGSTLKPFIYGQALDLGLVHSASLLLDVPLRFGDYRPVNFTGGFSGPVSLASALQQSLNLPAVQVLEQIGPARFYLALQQAGGELQLPANTRPSLAVALGGVGTSLESLVRLYSALGRDGQTIKPRLTPDEPRIQSPLMSAGAAWIIRRTLLDADNALPGLAVKTGTSYGNRDSWALAVSQHHTMGVWVGQPDGSALPSHFGRQTAVPLLVQIAAMGGDNPALPAQPNSVTRETICWPSGRPETGALCDEPREAWVLDGTFPATWMQSRDASLSFNRPITPLNLNPESGLQVPLGCDLPATRTQIALWPAPVQGWLKADWRSRERLPGIDPRCPPQLVPAARQPLALKGASDGTRLLVDPGQAIALELWAEGGQPPFHWYLNGEQLTTQEPELDLALEPLHRYQIVLVDQSGQSDRIQIQVRVRVR
ncbi:MAG: penicillin-binding protein 1C [Saccharospirillum sp.]|uniref:penicillin-binding protein 1C n=1 Tax=Saccharospirillum sp. TaxID=2033801 RepID=UPI00349FFCCC